MTDAAHNQHSETRRPSDRDRIVTTGPSRFQSARPEDNPHVRTGTQRLAGKEYLSGGLRSFPALDYRRAARGFKPAMSFFSCWWVCLKTIARLNQTLDGHAGIRPENLLP